LHISPGIITIYVQNIGLSNIFYVFVDSGPVLPAIFVQSLFLYISPCALQEKKRGLHCVKPLNSDTEE
jgi:hypothetical protein